MFLRRNEPGRFPVQIVIREILDQIGTRELKISNLHQILYSIQVDYYKTTGHLLFRGNFTKDSMCCVIHTYTKKFLERHGSKSNPGDLFTKELFKFMTWSDYERIVEEFGNLGYVEKDMVSSALYFFNSTNNYQQSVLASIIADFPLYNMMAYGTQMDIYNVAKHKTRSCFDYVLKYEPDSFKNKDRILELQKYFQENQISFAMSGGDDSGKEEIAEVLSQILNIGYIPFPQKVSYDDKKYLEDPGLKKVYLDSVEQYYKGMASEYISFIKRSFVQSFDFDDLDIDRISQKHFKTIISEKNTFGRVALFYIDIEYEERKLKSFIIEPNYGEYDSEYCTKKPIKDKDEEREFNFVQNKKHICNLNNIFFYTLKEKIMFRRVEEIVDVLYDLLITKKNVRRIGGMVEFPSIDEFGEMPMIKGKTTWLSLTKGFSLGTTSETRQEIASDDQYNTDIDDKKVK